MQKKYEVIGVVGEGAYGVVYKCKNKETGQYVAIKKFKETEDELVQKTMRRELKMLQMLKHENCVDFLDAYSHKGNLYLVFEYVEKNLLEVLEESPNGLSPKLIKSFVYQMCKAISYLHSNNMIHRDVKPENLLIDENMKLKLCDFGFARKILLDKNNNNVNPMTDYVATRWYRSPELLLSGGVYGPEVDYWAVGCIMGELADGNPMFPGENETDQIDCIIKVLGNLPEEQVNMFYQNPIYNGKKLLVVNKPETIERRYIDKLSPTALDFLKGLLQLDPKKRLNGETVFKHKYFQCFVKQEKEQKEKEMKEKELKNKVNSIDRKNRLKNNNEENQNNSNIQKENESNQKVINNTTNINIINYNNYNERSIINNSLENINNSINNSNKNNNLNSSIEMKNDANIIKKSNKNLMPNNINSQKNISELQSNNSLLKNNINYKFEQNSSDINLNKYVTNTNGYDNGSNNNLDSLDSQDTKKSLSVNKLNKYGNIIASNNLNNYNSITKTSLSQGKNNNISNSPSKTISKFKTNNYNNNKNLTSYNNSNNIFNINKSMNNINIVGGGNINNSNNNLNNKINYNNFSTNIISLLPNGHLAGYKTFFNKNDKYNYDINVQFKEENRKYNMNNNIIDENEEYNDYSVKKKSNQNSKEKKNNNNNKYISYYYDNYKHNQNKKKGYGTFYNYNAANIIFNNYNNKKNTVQLPQLYKLYNGGPSFGKKQKNNYNNSHYNKYKYY